MIRKPASSDPSSTQQPRWPRRAVIAAMAGLILTVGLMVFRPESTAERPLSSAESEPSRQAVSRPSLPWSRSSLARPDAPTELTAEEIVATKVLAFTRSRREFVRAKAQRLGQEVPSELERFFDALESGVWEDIDAQFAALSKRSGQYEGSTHSPELDPYWCAALDAYGVAEQAHLWPAQQLLDYGNSILESLRPDMVYIGGTDQGRWIPTLLNETGDGEPRVIITQNALADLRYLEFVSELYPGRLNHVSAEDSQRAFQDYVTDAQRRYQHDQQFPEEPKQLRPGEQVEMIDGRVHVGGQVAVMAINERILQTLMANNPDLAFAVQESAPLRGTYSEALPLGPLMELGAANAENTFTPERAAESLNYWENAAQQLWESPDGAPSEVALKSYSHDTVAAANLLAAHHFPAEAEQAYRLAQQLWPGNPEPAAGLAELMIRNDRLEDARLVLEEFLQRYPEQLPELERTEAWRAIGPIAGARP